MQDFHLPDSYYQPPEPKELALVLDDNEACCITERNEVDAWTWDGEEFGFVCPECGEDRIIVRRHDW